MRKHWTPVEDAVVLARYADSPTGLIAEELNRRVGSVYQRAQLLGLKKSEAYMSGPHSCRLRRGDNVGWAHRFKKGQAPVNKGLRRPGWAPGRMASTMFPKGNKPHNYLPVGTVQKNTDGYLRRKIADPNKWEFVHRKTWEAANGPIPRGYRIWWKDGNHENCALENLELLSGQEHMRRTTVHNYPKELALAIQMAGALNRQIRKRENAKKQDVRSTQPSI